MSRVKNIVRGVGRGTPVLLALALLPWVTLCQTSAQLDESQMRQLVKLMVRPVYPKDAIRRNICGVAVVEVRINVDGKITGLDVVEAPSDSIAKSVFEAVSEWKFAPHTSAGRRVIVHGAITFYFVLNDSTPKVLDPKDAGFVGACRKR